MQSLALALTDPPSTQAQCVMGHDFAEWPSPGLPAELLIILDSKHYILISQSLLPCSPSLPPILTSVSAHLLIVGSS